jgi:PIN domain nuclease of toxin-antitoxin system
MTPFVSESYVLDASALLCLLQEEKGAERVALALPAAEIGAVNYCEAVGKLVEAGMDVATVDKLIDTLQLNVISFDRTQARLAASLRTTTRKLGLSLGDRACLALAHSRGATALTCDSVWTRFEAPCKVELAR